MIEKIEHWKKQYDAGDVSFVAEMLAQFEKVNKQVEDEASVLEQLSNIYYRYGLDDNLGVPHPILEDQLQNDLLFLMNKAKVAGLLEKRISALEEVQEYANNKEDILFGDQVEVRLAELKNIQEKSKWL